MAMPTCDPRQGGSCSNCVANKFCCVVIAWVQLDKRVYVMMYCIYVVVYLVLLVISFIFNIFLQPQNIDFRGFFSLIICFFLNLMFFFVVRSYYLVTYGTNSQQFSNQSKV